MKKKLMRHLVNQIRRVAEKGAGQASIKGMHEPKVPFVLKRTSKCFKRIGRNV